MRRISLSGIRKHFGDVEALAGIDLSVDAGESVVVVGPSGCGKTTLLRIIAGLETASDGTVMFDDDVQTGIPPHQRDVAIVFQHFALYPHLSVQENITLGLRHGLGLARAEADNRATEIAERLDIADLLQRLPRELSGGQRQRVALGRAMARNSGILLLDEPLSGLDAQLRARLRVEVASTIREAGATALHVTHDQMDAMAMADRIVVMNEGLIEQMGIPEDIYEEPASRFVAGFIGSPPMNLLPGGVVGVGEPGETVGVRPEMLTLDGPGEITMTGRIVATELNGADWTVYIAVDDAVVAASHDGRPPDVGTVARLFSSFGDWHRFDGRDGRRIFSPS